MITAKEKAKQLVDKCLLEVIAADIYNYNLESMNIFIAKQCALIAVDEILNEFMFDDSDYSNRRYEFYQEIKQEIEKL